MSEICSLHPSCCLLWNTLTHKRTKRRSHTHKTLLALDSITDLRGFRARQRLADWFWHFHCLPMSSCLEYECGHKFPWEFNAMCAFVNQRRLRTSRYTWLHLSIGCIFVHIDHWVYIDFHADKLWLLVCLDGKFKLFVMKYSCEVSKVTNLFTMLIN